MASYANENNLNNSTSGDHAVTITPAVGALLVVFTYNTGSTADGTLTDDRGGTYTKITQALKTSSADKVVAWVRDQLVTSAVLHTITNSPGTTSGGGLNVVEVAGMTRVGAAAVKQSAVQENQGAGTPAPAFSSSVVTGNMTIVGVFNDTNAPTASMTPPTGWTERRDTGYNNPTTGWEMATRNNGFTGTTVTWGSSSSAFAAIILELDGRQTVTPDLVALAITGYAPTVQTPQTVTPDPAALVVTGYAPTVQTPRTVTPDPAALVITGYPPTVALPVVTVPGVASLALTAYAPDVAVSDHQRVVPDPVGLAITTYPPTVTASDHQRITPDPAELAITAYPPTVAITDAEAVVPGTLALSITGHPPRVKIEPVLDGGFVAETLRLEMLKREREAKRPQRVVPGPLRLEITTYPPTVIVIDDGDVQDILTLTPFDVLG